MEEEDKDKQFVYKDYKGRNKSIRMRVKFHVAFLCTISKNNTTKNVYIVICTDETLLFENLGTSQIHA